MKTRKHNRNTKKTLAKQKGGSPKKKTEKEKKRMERWKKIDAMFQERDPNLIPDKPGQYYDGRRPPDRSDSETETEKKAKKKTSPKQKSASPKNTSPKQKSASPKKTLTKQKSASPKKTSTKQKSASPKKTLTKQKSGSPKETLTEKEKKRMERWKKIDAMFQERDPNLIPDKPGQYYDGRRPPDRSDSETDPEKDIRLKKKLKTRVNMKNLYRN
jgi:hypothetical protein